MRKVFVALAIVAAALTAPASGKAQSSDELQKLIAGAKAEGKLTLWLTSPALPRTQAAVMEAFNKRFGLSTQYEWLSMHPSRSIPRLVTEGKAGQVGADLAGSFTYDDMLVLKDAGLLKPYPWREVFGKELPKINEPASRLVPELQGLGLAFFDNVFLLAWNTGQIKPEELPHSLSDLAGPKWKGRFVTNAVYGIPFDTLSVALGKDGALAFARKLLDNGPILKQGTPAVTQAITAGEAPVGISSFFNTTRSKKIGEPQDLRLFSDYIPVMPLHLVVPERSAHPNTARLFAAWMATEGVAIMSKMESGGRVTDPESELGQMVKQHGGNAKLVMPKTLAQVNDILAARRELNLLFTGR